MKYSYSIEYLEYRYGPAGAKLSAQSAAHYFPGASS